MKSVLIFSKLRFIFSPIYFFSSITLALPFKSVQHGGVFFFCLLVCTVFQSTFFGRIRKTACDLMRGSHLETAWLYLFGMYRWSHALATPGFSIPNFVKLMSSRVCVWEGTLPSWQREAAGLLVETRQVSSHQLPDQEVIGDPFSLIWISPM